MLLPTDAVVIATAEPRLFSASPMADPRLFVPNETVIVVPEPPGSVTAIAFSVTRLPSASGARS